METEQIGDFGSVCSVFVDSEFKIFRELFVEFLVIFLILGDFSKHLKTLLDDVLPHDLENFVLLEGLTRDVEWQVLRIDNTLNK
jgi:hypothetical protein